jgi:hypothetical protein
VAPFLNQDFDTLLGRAIDASHRIASHRSDSVLPVPVEVSVSIVVESLSLGGIKWDKKRHTPS